MRIGKGGFRFIRGSDRAEEKNVAAKISNEFEGLGEFRSLETAAAHPLPSIDLSPQEASISRKVYETSKVFQGVNRGVRLLVDEASERWMKEHHLTLDVENLQWISEQGERTSLGKWIHELSDIQEGWNFDEQARALRDMRFLTTEYALDWSDDASAPVLTERRSISTMEMFSALVLPPSAAKAKEVERKSIEGDWMEQEVFPQAGVFVKGLSQESITSAMTSIHAVLGEMLKARPMQLKKLSELISTLESIRDGLESSDPIRKGISLAQSRLLAGAGFTDSMDADAAGQHSELLISKLQFLRQDIEIWVVPEGKHWTQTPIAMEVTGDLDEKEREGLMTSSGVALRSWKGKAHVIAPVDHDLVLRHELTHLLDLFHLSPEQYKTVRASYDTA